MDNYHTSIENLSNTFRVFYESIARLELALADIAASSSGLLLSIVLENDDNKTIILPFPAPVSFELFIVTIAIVPHKPKQNRARSPTGAGLFQSEWPRMF